MRLSDANLKGRTVIAADGLVIGEIAALFLDGDTLKVESLQIDLRKDTAEQLGASHSFFRAGSIEIPVGAVQSIGATVVLSVPSGDLRESLPAESQQPPVH
jgi:sporulation protein YlmC with PRC-barrel domain